MIGTNDYPWATDVCGANNPANCSYSIRNCTDFAMWRMRHDLGLPCLYLGNALTWAIKAEGLGYTVNGVPALGSILQLGPGVNGASSDGHVAFVLGVGPGTFYGVTAATGEVVVEDFNWHACAYWQHTLPIAGGTRFIHFADLTPPGPPPPKSGLMGFVASPLGVLLIGGGIALVAWNQVRKHGGGGFSEALKPEGPRAQALRGAVTPGHGFARERTDARADDRWQDAYANAAERRFPGRDFRVAPLAWEEDDAVIADANAEVASER